jgi:hypothetical protein
MWPFNRRISRLEMEQSLSLIFHLQKMLAFQQLSMEITNDATILAIGTPLVDEIRHQSVSLMSPELFGQHVLPALLHKYSILEKLKQEHDVFGTPSIPKHAKLYELFSQFFIALMERGKLQIEEGTKWVANPSIDADMTRLDDAERNAMTSSLVALNKFIRKQGLSEDKFLNINCRAFNAVRQSIGLAPLSLPDFSSRYFSGISGMRVRFFTDEISARGK